MRQILTRTNRALFVLAILLIVVGIVGMAHGLMVASGVPEGTADMVVVASLFIWIWLTVDKEGPR